MAVLVSHENDGVDNVASLFDLESGSLVRAYKVEKHEPPVGHFATISNEYFIATQRGKPVCCIWQLGGHDTPLFRFPIGGTVSALAVSSCARFTCVAIHSRILVYETSSGNLRATLTGAHFLAVSSLRFSDTDRLLAAAGEDGLASVWHFAEALQNDDEAIADETLRNTALRDRVEAHALPVRDCVLTRDERALITASVDQTVRIHELQPSGSRRTRTVCELDAAATVLCIAPFSTTLGDSQDAEKVRRANETVFCATQNGTVFEVCVDTDSCLSGRSESQVRQFRGHSKSVTALACLTVRLQDAPSVRLVSTSLDGDVRVWDVASAQTVMRITVRSPILDAVVLRNLPHCTVANRQALDASAKQLATQPRAVVHRFNKLPTDCDDVIFRLSGKAESGSYFDDTDLSSSLEKGTVDSQQASAASANLQAECDQLREANKRLCLRLMNRALNGS